MRLGWVGKTLIGVAGAVAAAAAGVAVWLKLNRGRIIDAMLDARDVEDHVGKELPAFDVEQPDGNHVSKDSLLEGKEVAAVVLYASWCKPCEEEFPEMDSVYQKYQDKMGMVGIDVDGLDSMDDVRKYQDAHGLTFPMAYASGNESLGFVKTSTYPTTLLVDRNSIIRFWRVGSIPSAELFEKLVTLFMGDDYTQAEPAYYTFVASSNGKAVPGVEFTITTKDVEQAYVTDEGGSCAVMFDQRDDLPIKVTGVPNGVEIVDNGETTTGLISTVVRLPVK